MCRVLLHWYSKHSCHEGELGEDAGRCVGGRWLSGDSHVTLRCVGGWWLSGDGHVTLGRCVGGRWLSGDGHVTLACFTAAESPKMSSFWSGLDSSGWFSHIKDILDASVFIANVSTYRHL